MSKKQIKFISYYLLQFLKALSITFVTLMIIVNSTILNYKYIQNKLNKTNYYELLYNDMMNQMEEIIIPTGFDSDILKDTFTLKDVTKTEQKVIHNFYYKQETKIESSSFREKLQENINKDLEEKHLKAENEKDITDLVDEMTKVYENNLYYHNVLDSYKNTFNKIKNTSNIILVISILLLILFITLLEILHKSRDKMSIPLVTNGIIFMIIFIYFKTNLNIDNLFIYSKGLSALITAIFNSILRILIIMSIIYIVIGITNRLMYFRKVLVHKKKKKQEEYYEEDIA